MSNIKVVFSSVLIMLIVIAYSCTGDKSETINLEPLPIIPKIDKETGQPIQHTIRPFKFINQDSQIVTNSTFENKIYIADFFFIHCPTICPKVKTNMLSLYKELESEPDVVFLSHTLDTKYDTIPALKEYAKKLGVKTEKWHFVTGDRKEIYSIAADYNSSAKEDAAAEGGIDHSGYLLLVDKNGHIRSIARGTDKEDSMRLLKDIERLKQEK